MGFLRKRRVEMPKTPLGLALYQYDNIVEKDLKKIIGSINGGRKLNAKRAEEVIDNAFEKFDGILFDISRDKLKVDYRSDKIRYNIIEMINKLKRLLEKAKINGFDPARMKDIEDFPEMGEIIEIRGLIMNRMKDIESDYL